MSALLLAVRWVPVLVSVAAMIAPAVVFAMAREFPSTAGQRAARRWGVVNLTASGVVLLVYLVGLSDSSVLLAWSAGLAGAVLFLVLPATAIYLHRTRDQRRRVEHLRDPIDGDRGSAYPSSSGVRDVPERAADRTEAGREC